MTQPPEVIRRVVCLSPEQAPTFVPQLPFSRSWQQLLSGGVLPLERALALFSSLIELVSFLHSQGVVHRCLCPAHLHLDEGGALYLTGFERSIQLGDEAIERLDPSSYTAPEQCSLGAESNLFEPRSDLYSLGAILYELVTGAAPFAQKSGAALLLALLSEEVAPPRGCSATLSALCLRLLSKERQERPGSIDAMRDEFLAALLDSGASLAAVSPGLDLRGQARAVEGASTNKEDATGRYEVAEELSRDGVGRVLRVFDARLRRSVAMRELLRRGSPGLEAQFLREAMLTAQLEHTGVVPVHELGQREGASFYTTRLFDGRSLDVLIAERRTFEERLSLLPNVIAACEAIAFAHAKGVIHGDVRPQSVIVGAFGQTVVTNWGSSPTISSTDPSDRSSSAEGVTNEGVVLGAPAYLSLEQAQGKEVDARADVYSLGALLYQVLCGQAPYVKRRGIEVLAALLERAPAPIQERQPEVPRELAGIVNKAMSRQAKDRYADAGAMAEALRRFQTSKLVGAQSYTGGELFWGWFQKSRLWVTAGFSLLVTVVLVIVIDNVRVRLQEAETSRQRRRALESEALANLRGDMLSAEKDEQRRRLEELKLSQSIAWLDVDPLQSLGWLRDLDKEYPNQPQGLARLVALAAELRGLPKMVLGASWSTPECVSKTTSESMLFSHEGDRIFSGEDDGSLRVWFLQTQLCVTIKAHTSAVTKLALSPDGASLVSVGRDGAVFLWNTTYWTKTELAREEGSILDVAFSPDGESVAWGGAFSEIALWEKKQGRVATRLVSSEGEPSAERGVSSLAFQPGGSLLAAVRYDGVVQLWSTKDHRRYYQNTKEPSQGAHKRELLFSQDGSRLLWYGLGTPDLSLLEVKQKRVTRFTKELKTTAAAYSEDHRWLVAADSDGVLWLWDTSDKKGAQSPRSFQGAKGKITQLLFSPDGQSLLFAGEDGVVRVVSLLGEPLWVLRGHEGGVAQLKLSPNHAQLASASRDRTLRLWALGGLTQRPGHSREVNDLSFSLDGSQLVTASQDATTKLWQASSAELVQSFGPPQTAAILSADFSPGKYWVATASEDNTLYLRSTNGAQTKLLHTFAKPPTGTAFSKDGNSLWVSAEEGSITQWEIPTGNLMTKILAPDNNEEMPLRGIALLPGDERAVTVSLGGVLQVWDLVEGKAIPELRLRARSPLLRVSVSPEGRYVAAVGGSSKIVLWDLSTNQSFELAAHRGVVVGAVFASEEVLLSAGDAGALYAWDMATKKSVASPLGEVLYNVAVDKGSTQIAYETSRKLTFTGWTRKLSLRSFSEMDAWLHTLRLPPRKTL